MDISYGLFNEIVKFAIIYKNQIDKIFRGNFSNTDKKIYTDTFGLDNPDIIKYLENYDRESMIKKINIKDNIFEEIESEISLFFYFDILINANIDAYILFAISIKDDFDIFAEAINGKKFPEKDSDYKLFKECFLINFCYENVIDIKLKKKIKENNLTKIKSFISKTYYINNLFINSNNSLKEIKSGELIEKLKKIITESDYDKNTFLKLEFNGEGNLNFKKFTEIVNDKTYLRRETPENKLLNYIKKCNIKTIQNNTKEELGYVKLISEDYKKARNYYLFICDLIDEGAFTEDWNFGANLTEDCKKYFAEFDSMDFCKKYNLKNKYRKIIYDSFNNPDIKTIAEMSKTNNDEYANYKDTYLLITNELKNSKSNDIKKIINNQKIILNKDIYDDNFKYKFEDVKKYIADFFNILNNIYTVIYNLDNNDPINDNINYLKIMIEKFKKSLENENHIQNTFFSTFFKMNGEQGYLIENDKIIMEYILNFNIFANDYISSMKNNIDKNIEDPTDNKDYKYYLKEIEENIFVSVEKIKNSLKN